LIARASAIRFIRLARGGQIEAELARAIEPCLLERKRRRASQISKAANIELV
jgi:hypothetical protein